MKRLSSISEVVRDILATLLEDQDVAKITERPDVDLLIQQIVNGVCHLVDYRIAPLDEMVASTVHGYCPPPTALPRLSRGLCAERYSSMLESANTVRLWATSRVITKTVVKNAAAYLFNHDEPKAKVS